MFGRLLRKWRCRERQLFRYWDGSRERAADPLVVYRSLDRDEEFNNQRHPYMVEAGDDEATGIMLRAIQRAFDVTAYDEQAGTGLTQLEMLSLYGDFSGYCEGLKKNTSPSPTPPSPTDATSPDSSGATTSATSDCTCPCPEQPSDKLTPCEPEPTPH